MARVRGQFDATAAKFGVTFVESGFGGECSRVEVDRLISVAKDKKCDCVVGLGGGKAIDAAKAVAQGDNLIIVPTIAATDAPTSHSCALYFEDGSFDDYAYYKQSPYVVLVDTIIIAKAPQDFWSPAWATHFPHTLKAAHLPPRTQMLMQVCPAAQEKALHRLQSQRSSLKFCYKYDKIISNDDIRGS